MYVKVMEVNDPPKWLNTTIAVSVVEGDGTSEFPNAAGLAHLVSDPDAVESLKFSFGTGSNFLGIYSISETSGAIKLAKPDSVDFENRAGLDTTLQVVVTDKGDLKDTATVQISVVDVNEPPTFVVQGRPPMDLTNLPVDETTATGTEIGTIVGMDQDAGQTVSDFSIVTDDASAPGCFSISSSTGKITLDCALDYETKKNYTVVVGGKDSASPALSGTTSIDILVNDVNEAPTVQDVSIVIAENVPVDQGRSYSLGHTVVDPEDPQLVDTYLYDIIGSVSNGDVSAIFEINPVTGAIRPKVKLDHESVDRYQLKVRIRDNGIPQGSSQFIATVTVQDRNDNPQIGEAPTWYLNENSRPSSAVLELQATDEDVGDSI